MMDQLMTFSVVELIVIAVIIFFFVIELVYYLVTYHRPYRIQQKKKKEGSGYTPDIYPSVSVIIYAKNESVNLRNHLPSVLTQDYPNYEVIVINDGSTDESEDVLQLYQNDYSHLYHTFIPQDSKYLSRKKLALTIGIKAAKHEVLLFTEAHCKPVSSHWIKELVKNYTSETKIILGFCGYGKVKDFHASLISYDNLMNGLRYFSSALVGSPYTGNGRNLSYQKELFFQNKGYSKSLSLHAGEDDLFINQLTNEYNTKTVYSPDSLMEAKIPNRFAVWKEMKVSRAATERYFKGGKLFFYRLETLAFFSFLFSCIAAIVIGCLGNPLVIAVAVLLYMILYMIKGLVIRKASAMLKQSFPLLFLPFLELVLPLFNLYVRIYRSFRGKNDYTFYMPK